MAAQFYLKESILAALAFDKSKLGRAGSTGSCHSGNVTTSTHQLRQTAKILSLEAAELP
jgi:hypothetical protein